MLIMLNNYTDAVHHTKYILICKGTLSLETYILSVCLVHFTVMRIYYCDKKDVYKRQIESN